MTILRELFVKLGLDVDAQSFAKGQLAAEVVKEALGKVVDTAKELAQQFVENIQQTAEYSENITQLGAASGIGTKALQQLRLAALDEGIGVEDLSRSMVLLSRSMFAAKEQGGEQAKAFQQLGVRLTDVHGKLRPTEDVFTDIADSFARMDDGAKKTALSMELFGKSGAAMIELLNRGGAELRSYFSKDVLSEEQLHAGKQVVQIQRALTEQTQQLWRDAIGPLLPAIRDLLNRFYAWKQANAEIIESNLREYLDAAISAVKGLERAFEGLVHAIEVVHKNLNIVIPVLVGAIAGLVAANASLAASFVAAGVAATVAAVQAAIAWVIAAGPVIALVAAFVAVGAAIGLVIDDIRVFLTGGKNAHTVTGLLVAKVKELWNWFTNLKIVKASIDLVRLGMFELGYAAGFVIEKAKELWSWFVNLRIVKAYVAALKWEFNAFIGLFRGIAHGIDFVITKAGELARKFLDLKPVRAVIDGLKSGVMAIGDAFKTAFGYWIDKISSVAKWVSGHVGKAEGSTGGGGFAAGFSAGSGAPPSPGVSSIPVHTVTTPAIPASVPRVAHHVSHKSYHTKIDVHPSHGMDEEKIAHQVVKVMRSEGVLTHADVESGAASAAHP